ncbi:hypothetical protein GCM10009838_37310 [Catenulispora subtropica]|uniref:Uncharacterized protein n=1 Tax=Catenulispora subtropica TaxID=450798 RepID=A0ABN2RSN4_9ACTN
MGRFHHDLPPCMATAEASTACVACMGILRSVCRNHDSVPFRRGRVPGAGHATRCPVRVAAGASGEGAAKGGGVASAAEIGGGGGADDAAGGAAAAAPAMPETLVACAFGAALGTAAAEGAA